MSYNVFVFANPHWLKGRAAPGPTDLANAGLPGCFHFPISRCRTESRIARCVNMVLSEMIAFYDEHT